MADGNANGVIDRRLLELLVCPLTKSALTFEPDSNELVSVKANLAYPIRDGIPIMLPSEARPIDDEPARRPPGRPTSRRAPR